MPTRTKSLRVPDALLHEIDAELQRRGLTEWSSGVIELLTEAIRMRRAPGVVFVDSPAGRRAALTGTGLEVWEIIATWLAVDRDYQRLRETYDWLTEPQLRAAIGYYELYPQEIDARLERETQWTADQLRKELHFSTALP